MKKFSCLLLFGISVFVVNTGPVVGIPAFKNSWEARYLGEDEESPMAVAYEEAKCYVCHVDGENKDVNNPYGDALAEFLEKDNFKRDRMTAEPEVAEAEIQAALETVEAMESPTGETYGERIEAGLLPVDFVPAPEDDE